MRADPPFSVNVEAEDERHVVTVEDNGAVVSRETFSSLEEAVQFAADEIDRLSRKYDGIGKQ
jgi:hypothetical protein